MPLHQLASTLLAQDARLVTVESCTGGLLAARCTDLPGSSAWFDGGWVTYSNQHKIALGVDARLINEYGAVSEAVAVAMVRSALNACDADYAIAITGIAGPSGSTPEKPVGTVCFAWGGRNDACSCTELFVGDRGQVRQQSCDFALLRFTQWLAEK